MKSTAAAARRVRFAPTLCPQLRGWLARAARIHAHLAGTVRVYKRPDSAGGQSLLGDEFAARVAAGDRVLLHDCLTHCRAELDALRDEIGAVMDAAPPTSHKPGTPGKVAVMMARFERGLSLFVPGDAKPE